MSEGKKGRKVGRNKAVCAAYRASQRREFNKARRLMRLLKGAHSADQCAWKALRKLDGVLYSAQRSALGIRDFLGATA